jgi:hypothetical protein
MERDHLVAERVREQALARGMRVLDVDGSRTLDDVEGDVEEHLEPLSALAMAEVVCVRQRGARIRA